MFNSIDREKPKWLETCLRSKRPLLWTCYCKESARRQIRCRSHGSDSEMMNEHELQWRKSASQGTAPRGTRTNWAHKVTITYTHKRAKCFHSEQTVRRRSDPTRAKVSRTFSQTVSAFVIHWTVVYRPCLATWWLIYSETCYYTNGPRKKLRKLRSNGKGRSDSMNQAT